MWPFNKVNKLISAEDLRALSAVAKSEEQLRDYKKALDMFLDEACKGYTCLTLYMYRFSYPNQLITTLKNHGFHASVVGEDSKKIFVSWEEQKDTASAS